MKNEAKWKETKFKYKGNKLKANEAFVQANSLIIVNKIATLYEKYIKKYAFGTLLDVGCGSAPLYKVYRNVVSEIICIDWDHSVHTNIYLDFTADLNDKIPLKSNSVNTVLMTDVLEHISNCNSLMSEVSRVLCEEGILILGVPFLYGVHEKPHDFKRYTSYQLLTLCKKNKLDIQEIEIYGGPISVIFSIIGKYLPSKLNAIFFQKPAAYFLESKIGKKLDSRKKDFFPLGYCLAAQKRD